MNESEGNLDRGGHGGGGGGGHGGGGHGWHGGYPLRGYHAQHRPHGGWAGPWGPWPLYTPSDAPACWGELVEMTPALVAAGQQALERAGTYPAIGELDGALYLFSVKDGALVAQACTAQPGVVGETVGAPTPEPTGMPIRYTPVTATEDSVAGKLADQPTGPAPHRFQAAPLPPPIAHRPSASAPLPLLPSEAVAADHERWRQEQASAPDEPPPMPYGVGEPPPWP